MSTRTAAPGKPLRQERFASSFEKGLLGNLVAKSASRLPAKGKPGEWDQTLVWFVHWLSWHPEAKSAAMELLAASEEVRGHIRSDREDYFSRLYRLALADGEAKGDDAAASRSAEEVQADMVFRVQGWFEEFEKECLAGADGCPSRLICLKMCREEFIRRAGKNSVQTSVGKKIFAALDYAMISTGAITVIDGPSRLGKSFAVRDWCEQSAGVARYVEVPSGVDDWAFYRCVAKAIGVSSSIKMRAAELRARIEETVHGTGLMLVFDEAHYLWPQGRLRDTGPARVNWINTALVNHGVPVALITTPQFYEEQRRVERVTGWNADQFVGRIGHVERLPESLSNPDLYLVAEKLLPGADKLTYAKLVTCAAVSRKHLASIDTLVKRARWIAEKRGAESVSPFDVDQAIRESAIPTDSALAASLGRDRRRGGAGSSRNPREASAEGQDFQGRGVNLRAELSPPEAPTRQDSLTLKT